MTKPKIVATQMKKRELGQRGDCPDVAVRYDSEYGTTVAVQGSTWDIKIYIPPDHDPDPKAFVWIEDK